jgi:hypothetical protein
MLTSIILTAAFVILSAGIFRGKGPFSREGMKDSEKTLVNNPFGGSASSQEPQLFAQ